MIPFLLPCRCLVHHSDVVATLQVDVLNEFLVFVRCLLVVDVIGHPNNADVDANLSQS